MYTLKILMTSFLVFVFGSFAFTQADLCDNCYIWEFTTDTGERDQTTRLLSNDVEDVLSQYSSCKVLQRSRYARLQEQINNEKAIQSLSGANAQIKTELKTIQAKRVIFGSVNRDFQGSVSLRLSFENLQTGQVKSNTIFLISDDYYNFDKRKQKLIAFINSFINPDGKLPQPIDPKVDPITSSDCIIGKMPYVMEDQDIKLEFCKCYYYSNKITCPLWVRNKATEMTRLTLYTASGGSISRLIIDNGKDHIASSATIMSTSSGCCTSASIPVTKNGVPAQITFSNIQTKSKIIESLEICTHWGIESFADVPLVHGPPPAK